MIAQNEGGCGPAVARGMARHRAFLFSLEAAFSLTLAIVASAYLLAFAPQKEGAGEILACSDAAGALLEMRAFAGQERLQAAVSEAGALLGACIEAEGAGWHAGKCGSGASGDKISFSFPVWAGGKLQNARVACQYGA
jgi:hypothetical protein